MLQKSKNVEVRIAPQQCNPANWHSGVTRRLVASGRGPFSEVVYTDGRDSCATFSYKHFLQHKRTLPSACCAESYNSFLQFNFTISNRTFIDKSFAIPSKNLMGI
ncbi:hypothetical protein TNCT_503671 [Trichonephila clavata]|uniref:Uncharacterized protein n=1 Tax=Trichonephila clavata TaxID=2740835 RepID=A0A8X6KUW7_TRICU|nr:hypothetical protein TNCT_503671 [Trichonephila clavata]